MQTTPTRRPGELAFNLFLFLASLFLFWSAYGICLAVLGLNVALPIMARRRYLQQEARRLRRENSK